MVDRVYSSDGSEHNEINEKKEKSASRMRARFFLYEVNHNE
jgi:hypothetical protein